MCGLLISGHNAQTVPSHRFNDARVRCDSTAVEISVSVAVHVARKLDWYVTVELHAASETKCSTSSREMVVAVAALSSVMAVRS